MDPPWSIDGTGLRARVRLPGRFGSKAVASLVFGPMRFGPPVAHESPVRLRPMSTSRFPRALAHRWTVVLVCAACTSLSAAISMVGCDDQRPTLTPTSNEGGGGATVAAAWRMPVTVCEVPRFGKLAPTLPAL